MNLTHRRTGNYEPKGTPYPNLPARQPNQTHQMEMVGPFYLTGLIRFYGLNVIDTATARCGLHSSLSKSGQDVLDGTWAIWWRLGIPDNLQVDNAMSFLGRPRYPRALSQFVRLGLKHDVEPWFVPMAELWRNGNIEQFNDHYQQKFLSKVIMTTTDELAAGTMAFEQRHNSSYRYSKLGGKIPQGTFGKQGNAKVLESRRKTPTAAGEARNRPLSYGSSDSHRSQTQHSR